MAIDTLSIKTPIPCIQGFFGDRLVSYATQISPTQIVNLLGHDPRSKNWKRLPDELRKIYEFLQRKTMASRRESVLGYIEERLAPEAILLGGFPAISIALQNPAEFESFDISGKQIDRAVGRLLVDVSPMNFRVVVDGLARITGAMDIADEGKAEILKNFFFPVTIFAPKIDETPLTWREMGQLFHDFNFRVTPVPTRHALPLDNSDIYILLANQLGQQGVIKDNGGVAERAASLGSKSSELVILSSLVRAVRGACEGRPFQKSNLATASAPNLTRGTFNELHRSLEHYFSGIAARMGASYKKHELLHLSAPGWQALGVIHHDLAFRLNLPIEAREAYLDRIAEIDWRRSNGDWFAMGICRQEIDKKTGKPSADEHGIPRIALSGAGDDNTRKMIEYIRGKTGITATLSTVIIENEAA